jgi:hypothetical protein
LPPCRAGVPPSVAALRRQPQHCLAPHPPTHPPRRDVPPRALQHGARFPVSPPPGPRPPGPRRWCSRRPPLRRGCARKPKHSPQAMMIPQTHTLSLLAPPPMRWYYVSSMWLRGNRQRTGRTGAPPAPHPSAPRPAAIQPCGPWRRCGRARPPSCKDRPGVWYTSTASPARPAHQSINQSINQSSRPTVACTRPCLLVDTAPRNTDPAANPACSAGRCGGKRTALAKPPRFPGMARQETPWTPCCTACPPSQH